MAALTYFPAFDSSWAENGSIWDFDAAQYKIGWAVIGDVKPSVEQWNQVLQIMDGKSNYLFRQLKAAADDRGVATQANKDTTLLDLLNGLRSEMLDLMYPVGHIEIMATSVTPELRGLPGTWAKITDGFLYAHGSPGAGELLSTGGSNSITLVAENLPAHAHTYSGTTSTTGNHTHSGSTASAGSHTHSGSTGSAGAHTHTRGTMNVTGTFAARNYGEASNNAVVVAQSGAFTGGGQTGVSQDSIPSHTHRVASWVTGFDASRSWSGSTSSAGSHTHSVSINSAGAHTHSVSVGTAGNHAHTYNGTTSIAGEGVAFSIMPRRLTVYMWRRTA